MLPDGFIHRRHQGRQTATAANGTVSTLINIVKALPSEEGEEGKSKLESLLLNIE